MINKLKNIDKTTYFIITVILILLGVGAFMSFVESGDTDYPLTSKKDITVYMPPTCSCCGDYVNYLKKNLSTDIKINTNKQSSIRKKFGIPDKLKSCHTIVIGGKVVEGHMPLDVIEKMFKKDLNIRGIAMPGMPSGAPGMSGKKEEFKIFKLKKDGGYENWLTK